MVSPRLSMLLLVGALACRGSTPQSSNSPVDAGRVVDDGRTSEIGTGHDGTPPDPSLGDAPSPDAWFWDSTLWSPVAPGDPCGLYVADGAKMRFPRRTWAGCGPAGCQVASAAILATDAGVERGSVSAAFENGEVYLRQVSGASNYGLVSISRLSDG